MPLSGFLSGPLQVLQGCYKVFLQPSLLQAEQPQLSQHVFVGEVLHISDHFCGLLLGTPIRSMSFLHWWPQSRTQYSRWGLTRADLLAVLVLMKPRIQLLSGLQMHVAGSRWASRQPTPWSPSPHGSARNPFSVLPVFVLGIAPTYVQDIAFVLELQAVHTSPPLKPVKVPLDGIPSCQHVDSTKQLGVICRLAEGALSPTVHVSNKDIQLK